MVLDHTVDKHTRICLGVYSQAKTWMIRYGCKTMLPRFPLICHYMIDFHNSFTVNLDPSFCICATIRERSAKVAREDS